MSTFFMKSKMLSQRGFGLAELMIAMTLGLIVTGALAYFFLGSQQMNRSHDDISRMQESGRNALDMMGRVIRQAGYQSATSLKQHVLLNLDPLAGVDGASNAPDSVTVQYGSPDEGDVNCVGIAVAAGVVVTQVFAVDTSVTPPVLTCNGGAIVDNVEDMQISYGIDPGKTGVITVYTTAPTAVQFEEVAAVRISLLVKGTEAKAATNSQTYFYNGASVTKTDGFLRQVYTSTFTIRSQAR